jgi:CDP-4-dehydro-6-deoxyglucose reductase
MKERDILRLEAPLGTFFIRNDKLERPMILMGGGTGIAPLKSMLEDLLSHQDKRPVHLFWGTGNRDELYMHETAQKWAEENEHIQYSTALLKDSDADTTGSFNGFVHEAVLQKYADLSNFDIYMSGPPAMIDASRSAFLQNGAEKRRIFFDSFEFGLDVPIRVLAKSH